MSHTAIPAIRSAAPVPAAASTRKAPATAAASSEVPSGKASVAPVLSAATAALREVTETAAQTTKEAAHGDRAAQRILAKQQGARVARNEASDGSKGIGSHVDVKA
jgi:hypothetical protein